MDIKAAKSAMALVPQIEAMTALITSIEYAISEKWPLCGMKVSAPEGSAIASYHAELDLLPFGEAQADMSAMALDQALKFYQAKLDQLNAALAAL